MGRHLVELHVRDLGVIDDVTVALDAGMTALTGETGAGKTLLIGALSLLLGGRADPSVVRAGADEAYVEGRFVDDDGGDEVVLARSVARAGRSKAWIDGRAAPVGALTEAATGLLELHGQHQHRTLVVPEAQRRALDAFGAIDTGPLESARSRLAALLREADGLALSSRNRFLSAEERQRALGLNRALRFAQESTTAGDTDAAAICRRLRAMLADTSGLRVDYVAAVDGDTLEPAMRLQPGVVIALAAFAGNTRLIDNTVLV